MTYGGTRPWALICETDSTFASRLLGAGYRYKTEEAAKIGLAKLVAKGDLVTLSDGSVRTPLMHRKVSVSKW